MHMFAKAASLKTYPETLYLWTLGWGAWRARGVAVVRLLKLRYFLIFPLKNFFLRNGFAIFLNLRDCLGGCVLLGKSEPPLGSESFLFYGSGRPRDPQG